ncbi:uncharacterized protein [Diabrotica undecimpunctata]|uniref:uncharacterized protein n=1 Tax=Diabrotica undecimpunctata TaxID=50387 RepID=UPI003B63B6C6
MMNSAKTKVYYCCVCRKNSRDHNNLNLSFFRFPKDENRFAEWKKIVQCEKLEGRLKKNAKPSIHLVRLNIPVQGTPVEKLQTFASTPESFTYRIEGTSAVEELQAVASTSAESMMYSIEGTSAEELQAISSTSGESMPYSIEDAENVRECVFSPTTSNISSDIFQEKGHKSKGIQTPTKLLFGTPRKALLRKTIKHLRRTLNSPQAQATTQNHNLTMESIS